MVSQDQRGGMGSTNIQIANLHAGMTYDDVRSIAKEIFQDNFIKLTSAAKDTANARADEIREELLRLLASHAKSAESFAQPEKQAALFDAQKAFALSGDQKLKQLAIKAVLSIAKEPERSLVSIVLQETLKVLANLTAKQLKVLRIIFAVRMWALSNADSLEELFSLYQIIIETDGILEPIKKVDLLHLEYCGCGKNSVLRLDLGSFFSQCYPVLTSKMDGVSEAELYAGSSKLANWPKRLKDYWDGEPKIANFELTSVGIAIGHLSASSFAMVPDLFHWL